MERIQYKFKNKLPITLIDIRDYKQTVIKEINKQQEVITNKTEDIITPITDTGSTLMNSFNFGMMAFDTVRLGVRTFNKIGRFFRRRRKV